MNKVSNLESKNREYEFLSKAISNSDLRIKSMKRYLNSIESFYTQAMPSYLFAFYLQKSVPKGVKLNEYFVSDNEFNINASSYEIESLNEMITLLIASPIINKKSLSIKEIIKQDSTESANIGIEIVGKMLKLNSKKRALLYNESMAYGLSKKLSRFEVLDNFLDQ